MGELHNVQANGIEFGYLELGDGPLALCLHGFPDTAYTWRHLLPALADAGYRAVAPFSRGYAPSAVPGDGDYQLSALTDDALGLHEALGGDENAVLIGHDWGAGAAYQAVLKAPARWRRLITVAVPPPAVPGELLSDYDGIQRMAYMFFFQSPLAEAVVPMNDYAYLRRLWDVWSPGYDSTEDLAWVRRSLGEAQNLGAALGYYRALLNPTTPVDPAAAGSHSLASSVFPPTMYVHGMDDGCMPAPQGDVEAELPPGSRFCLLPRSGHFLHVEQPQTFNTMVIEFLKAD